MKGTKVIIVAVPILGERGEFLGVMAGMFRVGASAVSAFYGEIVKLRIGEGGVTYVVDETGQAIYHSDPARIGANLAAYSVAAAALGGQTGTIRTRREGERVEILASYAPIPGTPWSLVTESAWETFGSESPGYRGFLVVLLVLGVLIPMAVVTIGVRRITQPLEELIQAAGEVASGKFGRMLPAQSGDEIGQLTNQFNQMSARLQESYALLEKRVADRTQELEALYAADEELLRHLDIDQVLQALVDVAVNRLHADKSSLMVWDDHHERLVVRASHGL